jgi:hypothetical protein
MQPAFSKNICLRCKGWRDFIETIQSDLPDGQSMNILSIPICKNILLSPSGKSNLQLPPSHPTEGRIMIVAKRGAGCGGRGRRL